MAPDADDVYRPLVVAMRDIAQELLVLMQQALRGTLLDETLYVRAFGAKEGMVPQLQKIAGIVEDMRLLEEASAPRVREEAAISEQEKALIAHYLRACRDSSGEA